MIGKKTSLILTLIMTAVCILFVLPLLIVLMNSFKGQFFISDEPFRFPNADTFAGWRNYTAGIEKIDFFRSLFYSLFITVTSVVLLALFSSMAAWYLARTEGTASRLIYATLIASMIVPFQMVMFTMSKMANLLRLENPVGIVVIYLGFGAGLSVFLYNGFVRSVPLAVEEAAQLDGCTPITAFFQVILPLLRPITVTVSVLNAMWIWNDYLLPYLVIGTKYKTIPVAVQYLQGGYGSRDMGALMAMLVLALIPIIVFYAFMQKEIIRGVIAGAVKG